MKDIVLLVDQRENRRLLLENLSDRFTVRAPSTDAASVEDVLTQPMSLLIADGVSMSRHREVLRARKESERGLFLPYLLVTARKDVGFHTGELWKLIDDLLLTPVERVELSARVDALLRSRQYSVEAAQRYATLAETSPVGILVEQDGALVYCNRICDEIRANLGSLSDAELLSYLHAVQSEVDPEALRSAGLGQQQGMGQIEVTTDVGTRWLEVRWGRHVYRSELANMYLIDDITEQKVAERALVHAKERALQMERMKTAFLTNMSHEIRTPLAGIIGYAELLHDETEGDLQPMAEAIHTSGQRLLETLNSVLDLAQIEGNAVQVRRARFDAREPVRDALRLCDPAARKKGLELIDSLPDAPVWIESDRGIIVRILTNLLSNAVKFTEEGRVTASVCETSEGLRFDVLDTGIGIAPSDLPNIFREFEQVSTGLARRFEGSGLGLSIVRALVSLLGGRVDVESELRVGSTFRVHLPIRTETATTNDAPPGPPEKTIASQEKQADRPTAKPTVPRDEPQRELFVLLVEDDAHARRVLTRFLGADCIVTAVGGVEKAMAMVNQQPFDLVLADIALSEPESGIDLLRRLRKHPLYEYVPIVACTAYALPGDRERLLELGFDDYIAKPFAKADLLDLVSRVQAASF